MNMEIQMFAGADVDMIITKECQYYNDNKTIKSVKVIVTPDATVTGYNYEDDYTCIVEGWTKTGENGSLYKIYDKNTTETVNFIYRAKTDSSHMDGKATIVVNEIKKIYERTFWEDAIVIKEAYIDENGNFHEAQLSGGVLINKDRLNNLEEGVQYLYEEGATSKDIALSETEITVDTKIAINNETGQVKYRDGEVFKDALATITGDTLPIGSVVEIEDDVSIPYGYELVESPTIQNDVFLKNDNIISTISINQFLSNENYCSLTVQFAPSISIDPHQHKENIGSISSPYFPLKRETSVGTVWNGSNNVGLIAIVLEPNGQISLYNSDVPITSSSILEFCVSWEAV